MLFSISILVETINRYRSYLRVYCRSPGSPTTQCMWACPTTDRRWAATSTYPFSCPAWSNCRVTCSAGPSWTVGVADGLCASSWSSVASSAPSPSSCHLVRLFWCNCLFFCDSFGWFREVDQVSFSFYKWRLCNVKLGMTYKATDLNPSFFNFFGSINLKIDFLFQFA